MELMSIVWLGLMILFLVVEAACPLHLVSIWFALGAFAALLSAMLNAPLWLQIVWFVVVSVLALWFTRPFVKKFVNGRVQATNADVDIVNSFGNNRILANDHIGIGNSLAGVYIEDAVVIGVADQHRSDGGQAGSLNCFQIHLDQQLTLLDLVAICGMNLERFAFQTDSFQTYMDQNLCTEISHQADSVAGGKHHINSSVAGSVNLTLGRLDCNTVTQHTFCKSGIRHFCDRNSLTSDRSIQAVDRLTK